MLSTIIGSPQRTKAAVHVHRFVVFRVNHEWFVVYEDLRRLSFATREEAEASAFDMGRSLLGVFRVPLARSLPPCPREVYAWS